MTRSRQVLQDELDTVAFLSGHPYYMST